MATWEESDMRSEAEVNRALDGIAGHPHCFSCFPKRKDVAPKTSCITVSVEDQFSPLKCWSEGFGALRRNQSSPRFVVDSATIGESQWSKDTPWAHEPPGSEIRATADALEREKRLMSFLEAAKKWLPLRHQRTEVTPDIESKDRSDRCFSKDHNNNPPSPLAIISSVEVGLTLIAATGQGRSLRP